MNNLLVTYDLNGKTPTHAQVDKHLKALPCTYGRILETVWFVHGAFTADQLANYMRQIISRNDRLVVVQCSRGLFQNTLTGDGPLVRTWNSQQVAA